MEGPSLTHDQEEFVRDARVGYLATVSSREVPHVVPVCFSYHDGAADVVLDLKPKEREPARLRRVENIESNSSVALLVDRYSEDWDDLAFVLLWGDAEVVSGGERHAAALERLRGKYGQYREMDLTPDKNPVIRIEFWSAFAWGSF